MTLVATSSVHHWAQRLKEAEAALARIPKDGRADSGAVRDLEHALDLARSTPGGGDLARALADGLRKARRGAAADQLRAVVDRMRFEEAADASNRAEVDALTKLCRDLWSSRGKFLDEGGPPLPADLDRQVREDLLELVDLLTGL